jgi:hypothetical protein
LSIAIELNWMLKPEKRKARQLEDGVPDEAD